MLNELSVRTFENLEYALFQTGESKGKLESVVDFEGIKHHKRVIAGLYKTETGFWKSVKIIHTLPLSQEFPSLKGLKMTTLYGFKKHTIISYPAVKYIDKCAVTPILIEDNHLYYDEDDWYTKTSDIDYDTENMLWKVPVLWGDNPLADERFKGVDVSSFCTYERLLKSVETEKKAVELF